MRTFMLKIIICWKSCLKESLSRPSLLHEQLCVFLYSQVPVISHTPDCQHYWQWNMWKHQKHGKLSERVKQKLMRKLSKSLTNLNNHQAGDKLSSFTTSLQSISLLKYRRSKSSSGNIQLPSPLDPSCNISRSLQALCICGGQTPLSSPLSPHGLTFLGDIYTVPREERNNQSTCPKAFLSKKKSKSLPCIPQETTTKNLSLLNLMRINQLN